MKVVLDTNVLLSGANDLSGKSATGVIVRAWLEDEFELLSSIWQIEEIRRVSRYPHLKKRFSVWRIGQLINALHGFAVLVEPTEIPQISPDLDDNFILAIAFAGQAQYLVSRDKRHVLGLDVRRVKIITVEDFLAVLGH